MEPQGIEKEGNTNKAVRTGNRERVREDLQIMWVISELGCKG